MINGKAVIASRLGGNVDLIEEGKTGLLFNAGDADDLATKINYAIENKAEVIRMGMNAKKIAQNKYSPEKHVESIEREYQTIITTN